jgi:hypothetical protein
MKYKPGRRSGRSSQLDAPPPWVSEPVVGFLQAPAPPAHRIRDLPMSGNISKLEHSASAKEESSKMASSSSEEEEEEEEVGESEGSKVRSDPSPPASSLENRFSLILLFRKRDPDASGEDDSRVKGARARSDSNDDDDAAV